MLAKPGVRIKVIADHICFGSYHGRKKQFNPVVVVVRYIVAKST